MSDRAALDGHTLEQLQHYLDDGRSPRDPTIEESAACVAALDALARLRGVARELFAADVAAQSPVDEAWIQPILTRIADVRGSAPGPDAALRAIVRDAGDADPDVLVGRCRIDRADGDADGVAVRVALVVRWGRPIPAAADAVRTRIRTALESGGLVVAAVDILVEDLWGAPDPPRPEDASGSVTF